MSGRRRPALTPRAVVADALRRSSMPFPIRSDDPARCPNCGQRVTPYAAGCWLCGATLDPTRWQRPVGRLERLVARWRGMVGRREG
jgi:predicted amidophosphoribosyltransferase